MKRCTKCNEEKDLTEFIKHPKAKDGLNPSCKVCRKKYYNQNKERIISQQKEWYENNKDKVKQYYRNNKQKIEEYKKNNKIKAIQYTKKYYEANKKISSEKQNKYITQRRLKDPTFKFLTNVRSLIRGSFKRGLNHFSKNAKTEKILCCTIEEFKEYLESKFTDGMSFDNHGTNGWHLDHIIPISSAKTEEEIIKLNHYSNFQPLWAEDNLKKSNKII